jgi:arsenate reductase
VYRASALALATVGGGGTLKSASHASTKLPKRAQEPFTGDRKMTITIYGIKNCDTMKKARAWLDSHGVAYGFHDYKTAGIAKDKLKRWSDELGWETLLNRAGTTFRKLPDSDKEGLNERKALALMLAQPSMIKRPVLDLGGKLLVGFRPEIYGKEVTASDGAKRRKPS